jgi:beta-xylosidase
MIFKTSLLFLCLFAFPLAPFCDPSCGLADDYTNPIIDADYSDPDVIRVHLQPLKWLNDWPVIGVDNDGDGKGEPVARYREPDVGRVYPFQAPQTTDEFNGRQLGLQWQWHANPRDEWSSLTVRRGWLRLTAVPTSGENLWAAPNLLLQKLPSRQFAATTLVDASHLREGERSGLVIMGRDYSYLAVHRTSAGLRVVRVICNEAPKNTAEKEVGAIELKRYSVYLRVEVADGALCRFSYSMDGKRFERLGDEFKAQPGMWIGAKVGLFSSGSAGGYADYDWFRF